MVSVHHMEAHALTPRLTEDIPFPYLVLLVSGGHCILAVVRGPGEFVRLGSSWDDAPGEAFDKVFCHVKICEAQAVIIFLTTVYVYTYSL